MKGNMEDRAERLALYIIENRTTVRAAAQKFGISKSTVHTDVTKQNGPRFKAKRGPFFFPCPADDGRRIPAAVSHFR